MSILRTVTRDMSERNQANVEAAQRLYSCYRAGGANITQHMLVKRIEHFACVMNDLDQYIQKLSQQCTTGKNNNMLHIFLQTISFINASFVKIDAKSSIEEILDAQTTELFGNTKLLFFVVTMLGMLHLQYEDEDLLAWCPDLKDIINPMVSPVLHATPLSPNFNISHIATDTKNFPFLYHQAETESYYLTIPVIGYLYAGNRCDKHTVHSKVFNNHDCSSSLASWLGASYPFTTLLMIELNQYMCNSAGFDCRNIPILKQMSQYITPICDFNITNLKHASGLIVVAQYDDEHRLSGVVSEGELKSNNCLQIVSYNRQFPIKEGLDYWDVCPDELQALYLYGVNNDFGDVCPA
jgi:hypothetical protein